MDTSQLTDGPTRDTEHSAGQQGQLARQGSPRTITFTRRLWDAPTCELNDSAELNQKLAEQRSDQAEAKVCFVFTWRAINGNSCAREVRRCVFAGRRTSQLCRPQDQGNAHEEPLELGVGDSGFGEPDAKQNTKTENTVLHFAWVEHEHCRQSVSL